MHDGISNYYITRTVKIAPNLNKKWIYSVELLFHLISGK